jgi:hypothetical protein
MHFWLAIRCFFSILFRNRLPDDARTLLPAASEDVPTALTTTQPNEAAFATTQPLVAPEPKKTGPDPTAQGALTLLALLQREGRLLDFLQENIDGYQDAQIGAAVRDIHRGCKKALEEHLPVVPILSEAENAQVRVDQGFDPTRIRLVGNVVGEPPFTGTLRHHGWRTAKIVLPQQLGNGDPTVVAPAEVELG